MHGPGKVAVLSSHHSQIATVNTRGSLGFSKFEPRKIHTQNSWCGPPPKCYSVVRRVAPDVLWFEAGRWRCRPDTRSTAAGPQHSLERSDDTTQTPQSESEPQRKRRVVPPHFAPAKIALHDGRALPGIGGDPQYSDIGLAERGHRAGSCRMGSILGRIEPDQTDARLDDARYRVAVQGAAVAEEKALGKR